MIGIADPWMARPRRALAVAAVVAAVEIGCSGLVIAGDLEVALLGHGAVCAVFLLLSCRPGAEPTGSLAAARATAFLLPFLGPMAALSCLLILAVIGRRPAPDTDPALWHEHLFPDVAADALSERAGAIDRRSPDPGSAADIESFDDVLRWGTLAEQEYVLSLVSRSFRPEFAPVLRAGLASDDPALRAQAAAGLSMLEARTSGRLGELRHAMGRAAPPEKHALAVELAQALADAAHSGLFDAARSRDMREEIVAVLSRLAGPNQPTADIVVTLGRTLVQLGKQDEAVRRLRVAVDDPAAGGAALSWLLEARFQQRDFAGLDELVAGHDHQLRDLERQDGPLSPALRFWKEAA